MTVALDAIRARDAQAIAEEPFLVMPPDQCTLDRRYLLAALDRAEAVVAAARLLDAAYRLGARKRYAALAMSMPELRAALAAHDGAGE